MRKAFALISLTVLLAACGSSSSDETTTTSTPATTAPTTTTVAVPVVTERSSYPVGERRETYVDTSRVTDPNGEFKGAPERTIETLIWYPAVGDLVIEQEVVKGTPDAEIDTEHGPYPLILLSHGWTANPSVYAVLGRTWASAGYVVVAPAYPLSNTKSPGGPIIGDVKNQPADASFVLDQVLADDTLAAVIDAERIGAAGHSLGAITTLGMTFAACCIDDRIDAAIPMSGVAAMVDAGENYFGGAAIPVLFIHGTDDNTVPYSASVSAYEKASAPKAFVSFVEGDHIFPYIGGGVDERRIAFQDMTTAWFDRWLKDDETALDRLREAVAASDPAASLQESLG